MVDQPRFKSGPKKGQFKPKGSTTKSKGSRRSGVRSTRGITKLKTTLNRVSSRAADISLRVGIANIPATILTGRSVVHPMGGLAQIPAPPQIWWGDPNGTNQPLSALMVDTVGIAGGFGPMADTAPGGVALIGGVFGTPMKNQTLGVRLKAAGRGIGFNARRAFTSEGLPAVFGPLGVGIGIAAIDAFVTPAVNGAITAIGDMLPKGGR